MSIIIIIRFNPKQIILNFWVKFSLRWYIQSKVNNEHHQWIQQTILNILQIILKQITMILWTKFAQKKYARSKIENLNITIECSIFELLYEPGFILSDNLDFLEQTSPKVVFPAQIRSN